MPKKPLPNKVHYTNLTPGQHGDYIIFFIPGNPGLIQFYNLFLKTLHQRIAKRLTNTSINVNVMGITLRGFECGDDSDKDDIRSAPEFKLPLSIDGQLDFLFTTLNDVQTRNPHTKVILMGHSLGSFLTMEMLQRRHFYSHDGACLCETSTYDIPNFAGAIAVFPALTHLARSKSGKVLNFYAKIVGLVLVVATHLWVLGLLLPTGVLRRIVVWGLGYPEDAAETVARWWGSSWGIWESVHLGTEELVRIGKPRWDDEVWGSGIHLLVEKDDWVPEKEWEDLLLRLTLIGERAGDVIETDTQQGVVESISK
ncbi:hypothetical protein DM02DRAFT_625441 [Periconia macrospinosa]|uniref:Lipid droplet-associated hydrolase n=1 Tax=Periconia macrospinosa TaxID=97972 RepID=A0A2V1E2M4_9PLEO|nr:hypothetical protein DM02DRAFT_625441 [Periconia macrospinosa]